MTRLESIPGIGPQLADRLRRHFGSEEAFFRAASAQDLTAVARVPGLSARRAVRLIQEVSGATSAQQLLPTEAAQRLHEQLLERIQTYAATEAGRQRLQLLGPFDDPDDANDHANHVLAWAERAAEWDTNAIRRALARIRPATAPRPRRDIGAIVLADEATRTALESRGIHQWVDLAGAGAMERIQEHTLVINLHDDLDLSGLPQAVEYPNTVPDHDIVPELVVGWFEQNRSTLEALAALAAATDRPSRAPEAIAALDGIVAPATDARALALDIEELRAWADAELRTRVSTLSLSGDDLLMAMGNGIPRPLQDACDEVVAEAHRQLYQRTGLHLEPFVPGHPIEVDDEVLRHAEHEAEAASAVARHEARRKVARQLAPLRGDLEAELATVWQFDADLALGRFALTYQLTPFQFGKSLQFAGGLHLDLPRDGTAQPVTYELASAPVAMLTGANSGGKTTLLELVAQVTWMARLGLPVPAKGAVVPWVDELWYVTTRKAMDAGAFETFLRRFLPIAGPGASRMVLADEVEAMTELGAAAAIMGFFLRRLVAGGHTGVIVTHLAPQILATGVEGIRVDGIQATGLDAQGRLIVERTPRMGVLAASTPELIIERLARTAASKDASLWNELLVAVRERPGAPAHLDAPVRPDAPRRREAPRDPAAARLLASATHVADPTQIVANSRP